MSDWQNNNKNQIQIILIYPEDIIHLFLDFGDKIHFSLLSCQNIHNQILISSLVIPCYHKYSHNLLLGSVFEFCQGDLWYYHNMDHKFSRVHPLMTI